MEAESMELYVKTIKRMHRLGIKDPQSQIIELAKEIDRYRAMIVSRNEKIDALAAELAKLRKELNKQ